jgi:hypothetical protein
MRIRDASDVVTQSRLRLQAVTNMPSNSGYSGANMYRSKGMANSYNVLFQVQQGLRELNGGVASNQTLIPTNINLGNSINWAGGTSTSAVPNAVTFVTAPLTLSNGTVQTGTSVTVYAPIPTRTNVP